MYCTMKENILAMNKIKIIGSVCLAVAFSAMISACGDGTTRSTGWEFARNMYDPIAYNPDQPNPNFENGITAQLPPEGTTPIGFDKFEFENTMEDYEAAGASLVNPLARTPEILEEGAILYNRFCGTCHGESGEGDGSIVKLDKFPPPPSYSKGNSSRGGAMKDLSDGKIYHSIYYGLNSMGSHASQLSPEDRWKVVMHVHELQNK